MNEEVLVVVEEEEEEEEEESRILLETLCEEVRENPCGMHTSDDKSDDSDSDESDESDIKRRVSLTTRDDESEAKRVKRESQKDV
jgi:hypothetical protein